MKKTGIKFLFVALISTFIFAGCAKTPVADNQMDQSSEASTGMVGDQQETAPVVEPVSQPEPVMPEAPITLDRVYFEFDQATLSPQARDILAANAAVLQTVPDLTISIEGHCDDRGSDEYNLALGERRAESVRAYLVSLGVAPGRLETISYGEEMPLDASNDETAWAKNRRAEFKLLN